MPYIIILGIIFLNYVVPYKGIIPTSENEDKILDKYKWFHSNNLSQMFTSTESILNNAVDSAPTLTVLGDLNSENAGGGESSKGDKDFEDIDISSYI